MARFTSPTLTGYNASPPADDGTESADNQLTWAKHKTKIGDPLKTYAEASINAVAAMDGRIFPSGITTTASNLTLTVGSHNGKNIRVTGDSTITCPEAATATETFYALISKTDAGNTVTVDTQNAETIDGVSSITLTELGEAVAIVTDGSNWFVAARYLASQPFPRGYIDGFTMSNNGSDADHDLDISAGAGRDAANSVNISLTSTITKQINAPWAEGSAAGGFPSGLTLSANTTYHVFVLLNDDGTTVDGGFDTSLSATNLLSDATDYAQYRRIGSVVTDDYANIIAFIQVGDEFLWSVPVSDYAGTNPGTSAVLTALTVPTGIKVRANVTFFVADSTPTSDTAGLMTSPDQANSVPATGLRDLTTTADGELASVNKYVRTNTSGQVRTRLSNSDVGVIMELLTYGWIDPRGRDS